ncbi:MAG: hypothetical protein K8S23_11005 [Candidatus Cloacimonetes bacterium]|nr:hypothetical protein [Candidatus Cloacimonadota bacterium]
MVKGINIQAQLTGVLVTIIVGIVFGLVVGKIVSFTGNRLIPYIDNEELETE